MKRLIVLALVVFLFSSALRTSALAQVAGGTPPPVAGLPDGCTTYQIIATPHTNSDSCQGDGHALFIRADGDSEIELSEGRLSVINRDGTQQAVQLSLPNPDASNSGTSGYSVSLRMTGKIGTELKVRGCVTDGAGHSVCNSETKLTREKGTPQRVDVSDQTLKVNSDPIFSCTDHYSWKLNSKGQSHAELQVCSTSSHTSHSCQGGHDGEHGDRRSNH